MRETDGTNDTTPQEERADLDRRGFVKAVGAAGAMGAAGTVGLRSALAAPAAAQPVAPALKAFAPQEAGDFPRPEGLRPGAQSDSRFPVSYHDPVSQGLRLVMDYFTALNQRDVRGIADTLHFPWALNEDIEPFASTNPATPVGDR